MIHLYSLSLKGHMESFTDDILGPLLEGVQVKTDEERIREVKYSAILKMI